MYPHQAERLSEALERAASMPWWPRRPRTSPTSQGSVPGGNEVVQAPVFGVFTRAGAALVLPVSEAASVIADAVDVDHIICFGGVRARPRIRRIPSPGASRR